MAARSPRPASRRAATDPYGRLPPDVRAPGSYTEVPPTMDPAAPIGVVGSGYVGLVSAVCFAHLGHHLVCMDIDAAKIERLQKGDVPIYEPGLDKLIDDTIGRLSFTTSYDELLDACRILFIAVDTPPSASPDAEGGVSTAMNRMRQASRSSSYEVVNERRPMVSSISLSRPGS